MTDFQSTEQWQAAREASTSLKNYWDSRYKSGQNSGAGSYGMEAMMKADIINAWIKQYDIKTINEIGCGDGNNLLLYNIPISYTGFDLSPTAVSICNERTRKITNSLKYFFTSSFKDMDFTADLCLCLDVWFHQVRDEDFEALCQTLFVDGKWRYIIIYSTDTNSQFLPDGTPVASHMKPREVLSKVKEFPDWEVRYWISGFNTQDGRQFNFPAEKRFFLLERNYTVTQ